MYNKCPLGYLRSISNTEVFDKATVVDTWKRKLEELDGMTLEVSSRIERSRVKILVGLGEKEEFPKMDESESSEQVRYTVRDLENGLKDGYLWDRWTGLVVDVAPSDENAAKLGCLQAGLRSLRQFYRNSEGRGETDMNSWWISEQRRYFEVAGFTSHDFRIPVDALREHAEQVPDTEFQDWLEDF